MLSKYCAKPGEEKKLKQFKIEYDDDDDDDDYEKDITLSLYLINEWRRIS